MELVANIHLIHLAIVSGKDETKLVEFDDIFCDEMMSEALPSLIAEIKALGVIISSPTQRAGRHGAVVTLIDRTLEAFYVPIVRITNADTMIGDFRPTDVAQPGRYERIHRELSTNWISRGDE
jgi:hypothetical protein